jgi:peptide-methionine (S)-S-oxide reductase
MLFASRKTRMPTPEEALPGRPDPLPVPDAHYVNGHPLRPPFPAGTETAQFAMGCFWGAERVFWEAEGVYTTAVGYAGGITPNPTYEQVCSHTTGHAEVVQVTFDPSQVSYEQLVEIFWAMHDPTQVNRQGPDVGDQYRSVIFTHSDAQQEIAEASRDRAASMFPRPIATEILPAPTFYPAEDYHQRWYEKKGGVPYCHTLPVATLREQGLLPAATG